MAQIPLGNFAQARALPEAPQNRVITVDNREQAQAAQQAASSVQNAALGVLDTINKEDQALARVKADNALIDRESQITTIATDLDEQMRTGKLSYDKAPEAYESAVSKLDPLETPGLDEAQQGELGNVLKRMQVRGFGKVQAAVAKGRIQAAQSDLVSRMDMLGKDAAMPGANVDQINARMDAEDIDVAGRLAFGETWASKKQEFKDGNWTTHATQRVIESRESIGSLQKLEHDLTAEDGFYAKKLDPEKRNQLLNTVSGRIFQVKEHQQRLGLNSNDEAMSKAVSNLDVVTADLQTAVMKTRMQPIKKVFGRFPRLVRDLARQLKKEITLELVGEETDLDKNLVEALADPLVHLVRNAVDHGCETPEEREAAGKSRCGKVILSAEQEGDHILLSISDDGKGMDANILRGIAVKKGLMDKDAADRLSESDCYNLIFAPGFSTKTEISDVSGRGVGMDVVKTKIAQLNGSLNIYSTLGQGSKIVIKVPLTLAIMPTLMVMLGNQAFAFPLVNVNEIFHLDLSRTNVVDGQEVVIVRDKALPLFYLKRWLVASAAHEEQREGHVVILSVGTQRIGFVVDQLVGQEEVVIKPLGKMLQGTPGMSGATITGDGRIALILDVPSMLKRYAARRI